MAHYPFFRRATIQLTAKFHKLPLISEATCRIDHPNDGAQPMGPAAGQGELLLAGCFGITHRCTTVAGRIVSNLCPDISSRRYYRTKITATAQANPNLAFIKWTIAILL
jgi:hypothetical protein